MKIKNVVFDVGNVLVRWVPYEAINKVFPGDDPIKLYEQLKPTWIDLNLGKLSEQEAILIYQNKLNVSEKQITQLMLELKTSQTLIPGSLELLHKLHAANIPLYSITDNIKEIIEYHWSHSNFLHYFKGIVVSAELGILKPDQKIYRYLLNKYNLHPVESVFIDDLIINVEGALSVGMQAFQFTDAVSCENKLIELGLFNSLPANS
ncbi:MAG: HAD family phosphatase [Gammaproteobacteria bacterium]|jgi:putative hydrolase of the HAD superfamily